MSATFAKSWIRELHIHDDSSHRVGCIVAQRISPTKAKVAFSLCSPADKFSAEQAEYLACARLNGKAITINLKGIDNVEFEQALGLESIVEAHYSLGRTYDFSRNDRCLASIVKEVCETAQPVAKKAAGKKAPNLTKPWMNQTRLSNGRFAPKKAVQTRLSNGRFGPKA